MPMPPPAYNFASIPHVDTHGDRQTPGSTATALARGEGYLGFTRHGWQETLGVHMTSGVPDQVIVLPRPTYLPLFIGLTTATAVLGFLFKTYWLSAAAAGVVAALFVFGAQGAGLQRDIGPLPIGRGLSVPPHTEVTSALPWWALVFALVADATLFTSLIFGTLYLWIAAPAWPSAMPQPNVMLACGAIAALGVAAIAGRLSLRALAAGAAPQRWMALAALALVGCIAAVVALIGGLVPQPREHALGATASALLGFVVAHAGIGLLFLLSNVLRIAGGWVSARRATDLRLTGLWLDYCAVTGAIGIGLVLALPALVAMLGTRP